MTGGVEIDEPRGYLDIPAEALSERASLPVEVVETAEDLYWHFALAMQKYLQEKQARNQPCVFIVPVGPVGQYRRFAQLCNRERLSCRNLVLLGMDEYLLDDRTRVPESHPLSFRGFVRREFLEVLDPELRPPPDQVVFPDPEDLERVDRVIESLGGVDVAFGGVGINGHLAFNEPEPNLTTEALSSLGTRVVALRWETRVVNAITVAGGAVELIPEKAVTIGMRQILGAKRVRLYLNREWQPAVIRKLLFGPIGPHFPASLVRKHPDAAIVATCQAARTLPLQLR